MTKKRQIKFTLIRTLMAISIALLVAALLIFISAGGSTFAEKLEATKEALKQMLIGPLFRMSAKKGTSFEAKRFTEILAAMIPTIFTGLSVCVMFAANQFNMGAEGGIMLGAFISAMAAIYLPLPAGLHPVVAVILGGVVVALVMLIPAVLKAKLNVSEMVCSLMLNYIIMYVIKFLMNTYLADKSKGQIMSFPFRETSAIAPIVDNKIFSGSKLTWGFVIAIITVILCGLFIYRSRWGYAIRMIGINQDFSRYSGMNVAGTIILSQVVGGFLAGAGGGIEMLGRYTAFSWSALPGYGWTGITIAILAGNNPYMVPLAAFFMAYLSKGCDLMATYAKVPAQLIDIVQGVIFLFFAAEQFLSGYKQKLVVQTAQEEIARKNASVEG
ncbi:MAG: ABC transporter permease [Anaerolineaceae bacterium]|nr:ABC transporter permease [Anaerolineaceae bacterium]